MKKLTSLIIFVSGLLLSLPTQVFAQNLAQIQYDDTYIASNTPSSSFGSTEEIYITNVNQSSTIHNGLIKFDIIDALTLLKVKRATLRLYCNEGPTTGNVWIYRVTSSWNESSTWSDAISYDTTNGVAVEIADGAAGWVQWDVTDIVNSWLDGTNTNLGFAIVADQTQAGETIQKIFRTSENTVTALRPLLNLEYPKIEHSITQIETSDTVLYNVIAYYPKLHPQDQEGNFNNLNIARLWMTGQNKKNVIGFQAGLPGGSPALMYLSDLDAVPEFPSNGSNKDFFDFTPITHASITKNGLEMDKVTWHFYLKASQVPEYPFSNSTTGKWLAPDENISFGTDVSFRNSSSAVILNGIELDESYLPYSDGVPLQSSVQRAMYVWDQAVPIMNPDNFTDPEFVNAKRDFFSFIDGPKGEPDKSINLLFLGLATRGGKIPLYDNPTYGGVRVIDMDIDADKTVIREFIADLHSRGIEVHYLAGDPSWAITNNGTDIKQFVKQNHLDKVFAYNKSVRWYEKFDGIHFDIEPHILRASAGQPLTWNNPDHRDDIWEQFMVNLNYFAGLIQAHNSQETKKITFGTAIGHFYNIDYAPGDSYTGPGHQQVQDSVDYITVMNYSTTDNALNLPVEELSYADTKNPVQPVYVALETISTENRDVSFWHLGNENLEVMFNRISREFGNQNWEFDGDPDTVFYNSYQGNVIHFYEVASENSYRKTVFSLDNPTFDPDDAPVCIIESPKAGEFYRLSDSSIDVQFTVYDCDTNTLYADVYLIADDILSEDNTEPTIPLASNIVIDCNNALRTDTVNLTLDPTASGLNLSRSSNFRLFIDIKETQISPVITGDSSNDWFFINENIDGSILVYNFESFDSINNIVPDVSGLGNDAQVGNIASAFPVDTGKVGKAFEFNGVSGGKGYIQTQIGTNPSTNPTADLEQFTLALWFKSPSNLKNGNNLRNFKFASAAWWHGGANASGWVTGTHYFETWRDSNAGSVWQGSNQRFDPDDPLFNFNSLWQNNEWHLYIATYNRDHLIEYLGYVDPMDGPVPDPVIILDKWTNQQKWGQAFGDPNPWDSTIGGPSEYTPLQIGAWISGASGAMTQGIIDEVRIYNRALTQEEITMLWNNGAGRSHTEVTQWYDNLMSASSSGGGSGSSLARQSLATRGKDSDRDGLNDNNEIWGDIEGTWDKKTLPDNADSDGDLLSDLKERHFNTDPHNPDTDNDGFLDGLEVGYDLNPAELYLITDTDPLNPDSDNDGLTDGDETLVYFTDPLNTDSDNDGVNDGAEVASGNNPLIPEALIFEETYDQYQVDDVPNNVFPIWRLFGLDLNNGNAIIAGQDGNNWIHVSLFSNPDDVPPVYVSFGIAQDAAWTPLKNFSEGIIQFDIRAYDQTGSIPTEVIPSIITVEIFTVAQGTGEVHRFILPPTSYYDIPSSSDGWVTLSFDVNDLVREGFTPDLNAVAKVQVLFFQTVTDIVGDVVFDIDNFRAVQSPAHTLTGQVVDVNGTGLPNREIQILDNINFSFAFYQTDSNGVYTIPDIRNGNYTVAISPSQPDNTYNSFYPDINFLLNNSQPATVELQDIIAYDMLFEERYTTRTEGTYSSTNNFPDWPFFGVFINERKIVNENGNKIAVIELQSSPETSTHPAPLILEKNPDWTPTLDLSDVTVQFDILTTLDNPVPQIIDIELWGNIVVSLPSAEYRTVPAASDGWTTISVSVNDMAAGTTLDTASISKIKIIFRQTVNTMPVTSIDSFKFDNIIGFAQSTHKIKGTIRNEIGGGVKNVEVQVIDITHQSSPTIAATANTKASGNYTLKGVPNGKMLIQPVINPAVESFLPDNTSLMVTDLSDKSITGIDFTAILAPVLHTVKTIVTDSLGLPLKDAEIQLYDSNNNLLATDTTNNKGKVTFRDIIDGSYRITASAGTAIFNPLNIDLLLTKFDDKTVTVNFQQIFSHAERVTPMLFHHHNGSVVSYNDRIFLLGAYFLRSGNNKLELYIPDNDTWQLKNDLIDMRYNFGTFVLNDQLYIVGGQRIGDVRGEIFRYDINSDQWEQLTTTGLPAMFDTSCAVVDGKVYVLAGHRFIGNSIPLESVYELDNTGTSWNAKTPPPLGIGSAPVEVYDGKIYLFGGNYPHTNGTPLYRTEVQVYDPSNDSWSFAASIPGTVYEHDPVRANYTIKTVQFDKKIFLFTYAQDGFNQGIEPGLSKNIHVYDLENDSWAIHDISQYLPFDLVDIGITQGVGLVGEYVYFMFNGDLNGNQLTDVFRFSLLELITDYSEPIASIPHPHHNGSVVSYNNELYVMGAFTNDSGTNKLDIYSPDTDSWTAGSDLPVNQYNFGTFTLNNRIYTIGGQPGIANTVFSYNIADDNWIEINNDGLPAMFFASTAVVNDTAYILAGHTIIGTPVGTGKVYEFESENETWIEHNGPPLPIATTPAEVYNGKIYLFGGNYPDNDGKPLYRTDVQIYDPANDSWELGAPIPDNIYFHNPLRANYFMQSVVYNNHAVLFTYAQDGFNIGIPEGLSKFVHIYSFEDDSWSRYDISNYLPLDSVRVEIVNGVEIIGDYAYFVFNSTLQGDRLTDVYRFSLANLIYSTPHPADTDRNWRIVADEESAYSGAWRLGETWGPFKEPIDIHFVTRAGYLLFKGEKYKNNGSGNKPDCWIPSN